MMIKKEWEVRHGFDPIGVLGFVASVDTYRTQAQAKARVRELHDTGIVPAGERVEVRYIGEGSALVRGQKQLALLFECRPVPDAFIAPAHN